jgi:signal transduction histidine kinase/ActR/RegA family two-component response regulator
MNANAVVLVVESDASQLDRLREDLEKTGGFTVRGCASVPRAAPMLSELTPGLVLLGPSFQSGDIATSLERLRALASVPIMAVADPAGAAAKEMLRAGVADVVEPGVPGSGILARRVSALLELKALRNAKTLLETELHDAQRRAAIGILAGGVAHDLNNVLTGMLGETQLALAQSAGREIEANLRRLDDACTNMTEMVRRLMTYGNRETRRRTPVDVAEVVARTGELLAHSLPKNIQVSTELADDARVLASRAVVQQIVLNLAVNAMEAMPEGGRLGITVAPLRPGSELLLHEPDMRDEEYVVIEVADTGRGVPEEHRERIFEPYFSTKHQGASVGAGLGLPTVLQLTRELHGVIALESAAGNGTTFRVYLPRHAEKEASQAPAVPEAPPRGTEGVLVVDDEPVVLHVTSRLLQHLGYKPICAGSGQEAIDLLETMGSEIACAVLDLSMPEMGGVECGRRLREAAPDLPIIFASGHNLEAEEEELRREGCVACIQKPFQMRDLAVRLRAALDAEPAKAG